MKCIPAGIRASIGFYPYLGCEDFDALAGRVNELVKPQIPAGLFAKLKKLPDLIHLAALQPRLRHGRFG